MQTKVVNTYVIRLYMGGDIKQAKVFLRKEVYPPNEGLCVTIEPTTFIYTGGEELGFVVGFLIYPRFQNNPDTLYDRARDIAKKLIVHLCQRTALLVANDTTEWIRQDEDLFKGPVNA